MKCTVCKDGETRRGTTTITLEREKATLVFKGVPAEVCPVCGEGYLDEATTSKLLKTAEEAARSGIQVDVREYKAA